MSAIKKQLKSIPKFKTYEEETIFWKAHDFADYLKFDNKGKLMYHKNLVHYVTVRFSTEDIIQLRRIAAEKNLGVATFIRLILRNKFLPRFEKVGT